MIIPRYNNLLDNVYHVNTKYISVWHVLHIEYLAISMRIFQNISLVDRNMYDVYGV